MVPPGKRPAGEASNSNKKCKRYFNEHWKSEFTWLEFDYDKKLMFCRECRQALVRNKHGKADSAFSLGTDNFQRHALLRHVASGAHKQALMVNKGQPSEEQPSENIPQAKCVIKAESKPFKIAVMSTIYWMVKEDIPQEKCASLLELQKFNHCQTLLADDPCEHCCLSDLKEMQEAIVKVLQNEDRHRMNTSQFIGLILDGTVNVKGHQHVIMFSTAISPCDGHISIIFLGSFELPVADSHIVLENVLKVMKYLDVPMVKLSWLSSIGSSVMVNKSSGVGKELKHFCPILSEIHCVSQKNELFPSVTNIEYIKKYEETVDAVFRLSSNLEAGEASLWELQHVLNLCEIDIENHRSVHWTSILQAVEAIDSSWPVLILFLEHNSGKSPMAFRLCEELKTFQFVAFTKLLLDVLLIFQKLSRFFQMEELDLSMVKPIVSATIATLIAHKHTSGQHLQKFINEMNACPADDYENTKFHYKGVECDNFNKAYLKSFEQLKKMYLESICGNLQDRFPNQVLDTLNSFSVIFNPKAYPRSLDDIGQYGNDELCYLLAQYSQAVVGERAMNDFPLFKRIVFSVRQLSFKDLCVKLVHTDSEMHELFPDFSTLAGIVLALPVGSFLYEKINKVKQMANQRCSLVKHEGLSNIMKIAIDGPTIKEFDFAMAVQCFDNIKRS
ncbi:transmembrane protein C17orf113 homolog [Protopterus annectens]|uniref:transmembrane protein C17orf113 homolog n=1 Tax=Protopterus annectens TaxID=7888 RepID=UPI001CFA28AF|nr:transmembrane protein C17orf113 homolog [Protopterus annectens]XP_043910668.1 transmembrane protein C17orf113 homolog [Protopterus annectens]